MHCSGLSDNFAQDYSHVSTGETTLLVLKEQLHSVELPITAGNRIHNAHFLVTWGQATINGIEYHLKSSTLSQHFTNSIPLHSNRIPTRYIFEAQCQVNTLNLKPREDNLTLCEGSISKKTATLTRITSTRYVLIGDLEAKQFPCRLTAQINGGTLINDRIPITEQRSQFALDIFPTSSYLIVTVLGTVVEVNVSISVITRSREVMSEIYTKGPKAVLIDQFQRFFILENIFILLECVK